MSWNCPSPRLGEASRLLLEFIPDLRGLDASVEITAAEYEVAMPIVRVPWRHWLRRDLTTNALAKLFPFGNKIILVTVGVTLLHCETLEARPLAERALSRWRLSFALP